MVKCVNAWNVNQKRRMWHKVSFWLLFRLIPLISQSIVINTQRPQIVPSVSVDRPVVLYITAVIITAILSIISFITFSIASFANQSPQLCCLHLKTASNIIDILYTLLGPLLLVSSSALQICHWSNHSTTKTVDQHVRSSRLITMISIDWLLLFNIYTRIITSCSWTRETLICFETTLTIDVGRLLWRHNKHQFH